MPSEFYDDLETRDPDQRERDAFARLPALIALAMGAACVVAPGRNDRILTDLVRRFGDRVKPVKLTGNESDEELDRILQAKTKDGG